MVLSQLLSRVLGIVREMIISHKFGQGLSTDAYTYSFQIPDVLFFLIAGGALSSAFIPVFSEYLHTDRKKEAWHVFSSVATIMALAVTLFIVAAWVFAPLLAPLVAPGLAPADREAAYPLIVHMSRIVLPAQFAFFIGGLLFGTLYANQVFAVPGLGPNIYNIGIIFGALVVSSFFQPGVIGMSWGALGGAFIGNILVPMWAMRKINASFRPVIDFKHEGVRKVFRLMAPVVFGLSLPGVFALFLVSLSSFYGAEGQGIATAFRNSNQLMQAPLGVFGQALALGVFPALSQFFAMGRMDMYRSQLAKTLRTVVFLTVPVSLMMLVGATDIVRALLQSGNFTAEDTARTAPLLMAFAIGVPAWCLQPVLMRAFFAVQETKKPILIGTLTTGIFLALSVTSILMGWPAWTLAAAGSASAVFLAVTLGRSVSKRVEGVDMASVLTTAGKAIVAALPATLVFWGAYQLATLAGLEGHKVVNLGLLLAAGSAAGWVYFQAAKWLGMEERSFIERAVRSKSDRSEPPETEG